MFRKKEYVFFAVYDGTSLTGILAQWDLGAFLFVEHLAIRKELRGKGLGTAMLEQYLQNNKHKKKIILEVEATQSKRAEKVIRFYEKKRFKLNSFDYLQPSYGPGKKAVSLHLMSYPRSLSRRVFTNVRSIIHTRVYGLKQALLQ